MTQTVQHGQSILLWETLTTLRCGSCNILFAIPDSMLTSLKKDGDDFWCPNGHKIHYFKNENSQLKEEVEALKQRLQWRDNMIAQKNERIEQLNYSVRAQKAAKTKIINRVKNGVCPCCNRTFQNLQNHFKTVHPELLQ